MVKMITLLATIFSIFFLSGCDAGKKIPMGKPDFTIKEAESACETIMYDNCSAFSDDGKTTFKILSLGFQNDLGSERIFAVIFQAKRHGDYCRVTQKICVGKDKGGWYVEMVHNGVDMIKFRKGNQWKSNEPSRHVHIKRNRKKNDISWYVKIKDDDDDLDEEDKEIINSI